MRLLVNIRGTNGSGKSTIPILMKSKDPDVYEVEKPYRGKPKTILTVCPTYGWVILGQYSTATGGLDQFPRKAFTEKVLQYAIKKYPDYNILMEGILAATTYSTYVELFKEVQDEFDIQPVVYYYMPPFETCIERIKQRNGGRGFKEHLVYSKYGMMQRGIKKFEEAGDFPLFVVDNSTLSKSAMLQQFFDTMKTIERKDEN